MKQVKKKYNIRLKIKKNDIVKVTSGVDAGKQGKVLEVYPRTNRAIVEGVNMVKKHQKPNADNPQGGILEQEAPINISNLLFVDAKGNATRVGFKIEDGKKVRYSKKSGDIIK